MMSERFVFTSRIKFDESHYELKCSDYFKQFDGFCVILRSILSMFKSGVLALVIPNVDQPRSQGPLLLGPRGERERESLVWSRVLWTNDVREGSFDFKILSTIFLSPSKRGYLEKSHESFRSP